MKPRRSEKLASLIKREVSEIILYELNDPVFKQFISITEVKLEGDLKKAIIYFRVFGAEKEEVEKALERAKGYIKKLLAERITIKFMPDIEFKPDDTEEKEKRLAELFEKIKEKTKTL
jgi:ribosome-binding factor A